MKKIIIIGIIVLGMFLLKNPSSEILIPKEAIRFRVIANSNSKEDQETKIQVRNKIQAKIFKDLENTSQKIKAKNLIENNISEYDKIVKTTLEGENISTTYDINYGMNYFPEKLYKGVRYEEGYYESLVVTLGNGLGDNWWCVLFPPLCLLEAEETEETTEVEYKFFISELIAKYF